MTQTPQIGDPVALRDSAGLLYASRVEGVDEGYISVARPADLRAAVEYQIGMTLEIVWTETSGIHVVPTQLAAASVERNVRLWHLERTGDGWSEQRRDYVRVATTATIAVTPRDADAADSDTVHGNLVDLSEVAAQCAVPVSLDDPRVAVGRSVGVAFTLIGDSFDVAATVVKVRPGSSPMDCRVVVQFDSSTALADAIRKKVFQLQIAGRRRPQ